jgi:hypothetical protein
VPEAWPLLARLGAHTLLLLVFMAYIWKKERK